jgi:CRISPR-associated protein Cas2
MVILVMEKVPVGLRGELSRWMIEPKANVFVGRMSAMVRDKLWELACEKTKGGAALLIYPARTEQGFTIRTHGPTSRQVIDYEGLLLVRIPKPISKEGNAKESSMKSDP